LARDENLAITPNGLAEVVFGLLLLFGADALGGAVLCSDGGDLVGSGIQLQHGRNVPAVISGDEQLPAREGYAEDVSYLF